jgi:hypothetical protein
MKPGVSQGELMRQQAAMVRQRREKFRKLVEEKNTTKQAVGEAIVTLHDGLNSVSVATEAEFARMRLELGRTRRSLSDVAESQRRRLAALTTWAALPWYRRTRKALVRLLSGDAR